MRLFEIINLNSILRQPNLTSKLPQNIRNKFDIRKIFTFDKPVSSKILNYNKILRSTGTMSYQDILDMACDCAASPFKNDQFDHVITGDLHIIKEIGLRKLCSYGTKFWDTPRLNLSSIKNQFQNDVDCLVKKISKKFKITFSALKAWKKFFIQQFNSKLQLNSTLRKFPSPTLSNVVCRKELKALQERYVITVVDKASGNYAFTCRKFYFLKLAEELGLNNATPGNDTY